MLKMKVVLLPTRMEKETFLKAIVSAKLGISLLMAEHFYKKLESKHCVEIATKELTEAIRLLRHLEVFCLDAGLKL